MKKLRHVFHLPEYYLVRACSVVVQQNMRWCGTCLISISAVTQKLQHRNLLQPNTVVDVSPAQPADAMSYHGRPRSGS